MAYRKLSDGQWEMLEHLVPKQEMGRPRSRDREMLDAILYVLHTGCRWEELPKDFPPKSSVHSRFRVWAKTGFFKQVLRTLGQNLAPSQVFHLDSTLKAAKKGDKVGRARPVKGSKISLVVNEAGLPLAVDVCAGNTHDLKACGTLLYSIPKGSKMTADRGYDSKLFRRKIRSRGIQPIIPKRRMKPNARKRIPSPVTYQNRWLVERCFAWMEKFKRLTTRYERHAFLYKVLWQLAASVILLDKLTG